MAEPRLLVELRRQAANTKSRIAWAKSLCRIAIFVARQGNAGAAREQVAKIRQHYGDELHPQIAPWVMLAEGVTHFSVGDMRQAFERTRRAYALGVGLRAHDVIPLSAAWMALLDFNAGRYETMISHLHVSLDSVQPEDRQAIARSHLVVADALHYCGKLDEALPWYEKAKVQAGIDGDQATLSAYLYNLAVFRVANLRLNSIFRTISDAEVTRAALEADSSFSYDMVVKSFAFGTLWKILHAQILILQNQHGEASILLETIDPSDLAPRDVPFVLADLAWCKLITGDDEAAAEIAVRAKQKFDHLTEADDIAYVAMRLTQVAHHFGQVGASEEWKTKAGAAFEEHTKNQALLYAALEPLLLKYQPKKKQGPLLAGPTIS